MTRRKILPIVLLVSVVVLAGSAAKAAEDVLKVIPDEALGFVVVNRLAEIDAKLQALGKQTQLPARSPMEVLRRLANVKEGLSDRGSAAIVAVPSDSGGRKPAFLLYLPVTDFGKFVASMTPDDPSARIVKVDAFGDRHLVASLGGYAVFTEVENRPALERVLDSGQSVHDRVAFLMPWLSENDATAVVTSHGVKLICSMAQEGLRQARAVIGRADEKSPAASAVKVYEDLVVAARDEVDAIALGVKLDPGSALRVTTRTRFASGREAFGAIAEVESMRRALLSGLPADPYVLAVAGLLPEGAGEALLRFSMNMMKAMPDLYGFSEGQVDRMTEEARGMMKDLRGMSMVLGAGKPGDPIYSNAIFVMRMDDASGYLDAYEKYVGSINEMLKDVTSPFFSTMEVERMEIAGQPGLKLEMAMPGTAPAKGVPNMDAIMEKMFGPGGKMTLYLGTADEKTVVAAYTDKESLVRSLEAARQPGKSLAGDQGTAETTALLPPDAPLVGYWSPKGTVDFINRIIPEFAPGADQTWRLPEFADTPPVGFAAKMTRDELQTHLVVPAEVLRAVGTYAIQIRKLRAEEAAPP